MHDDTINTTPNPHPSPRNSTASLSTPTSPPSDPEKQATTTANKASTLQALPLLDRLLFIFILLAMVIGILLSNFVPSASPALQRGQFVHVSVPLALGLLVMMYPILCKTRFEILPLAFRSRDIWIQLAFSVIVNWIVAPLLMLALAWAFLPDESGLREGVVLVGLARCIAMVLVWTGLAGGDVEYCALIVAVNSVLQMVLYAPLALLFIGVIGRHHDESSAATVVNKLSYSTVATSVAVFLGIPLAAAIVTRVTLRRFVGAKWYDDVFVKYISPFSLLGLLFTIIVLFASQGHRVVHQIVAVLRVAAPLIVYFAIMFFVTLLVAWKMGFGYRVSATQGFTAASNNFELAIAVAVAVFGKESDQALASTVGPLVEVPVLLGLVFVLRAMGGRWRARD